MLGEMVPLSILQQNSAPFMQPLMYCCQRASYQLVIAVQKDCPISLRVLQASQSGAQHPHVAFVRLRRTAACRDSTSTDRSLDPSSTAMIS
jgi:hypothetical protein